MKHMSPSELINPSNQSLCLCIYIRLLLLGNGSERTFQRQRRMVGGVIFCAVHIVSKQNLLVRLCIPLSLLCNGSERTFPRQRRIIGGVIFYANPVVSRESKRLILPRTTCNCMHSYVVPKHRSRSILMLKI
jgi:hypothetical protein